MNIVWITASVLAWGAVHSWLASDPVKRAAQRLIGDTGQRIYRLAFNVFAGVTLLPILLLARLLPDHALYTVPAPWVLLMLAKSSMTSGTSTRYETTMRVEPNAKERTDQRTFHAPDRAFEPLSKVV